MAAKKHFNIAIPKSDGGIEIHRMMAWLRQHPDENPTGLDPQKVNSHSLRNALRKVGWSIKQTKTEVLLIKPSPDLDPDALDQILGPPDEAEEGDDSEIAEVAFALEYQLRDFIAQNLNMIDVGGKHLKLYTDSSGRNGIEYPSGVGPIDILAVDETGSFYVFELKRARSPDHAIGQLARYMGWVRQTIGAGRQVNGFIVAKTISNNLHYAVSVIPNVGLFEYEVEFRLKAVNEVVAPASSP